MACGGVKLIHRQEFIDGVEEVRAGLRTTTPEERATADALCDKLARDGYLSFGEAMTLAKYAPPPTAEEQAAIDDNVRHVVDAVRKIWNEKP
jgi:hypothetical protein